LSLLTWKSYNKHICGRGLLLVLISFEYDKKIRTEIVLYSVYGACETEIIFDMANLSFNWCPSFTCFIPFISSSQYTRTSP